MRVTAFAGGVGGAKLIDGLAACLPPKDLTVIVNTGDDFDFLNLHISPDIDTICYTLAGISNPETGWGIINDNWTVLDNLKKLGGPAWFQIGDKDFSTHIERTRRLHNGETLSAITEHFCNVWGVKIKVLPMTNDPVSTCIKSIDFGDLPFQDYFVRLRCKPVIKTIEFKGVNSAKPAPGVEDAISEAEVVIICPSNPWVSIDPIISLKGILQKLINKPSIAISPIIHGKAVKGPAAKMFKELGIEPSALAVADHYKKFVNAIVIDNKDHDLENDIKRLGLNTFITNTLMVSKETRIQVAKDVLNFCERIID